MNGKISGYVISVIVSSGELSDADIQSLSDKINDIFDASDSVNISVKPIVEDNWTLNEEKALELADSKPTVIKDTGIPLGLDIGSMKVSEEFMRDLLARPRDVSEGAQEMRRMVKRAREMRKGGVFNLDPKKDE